MTDIFHQEKHAAPEMALPVETPKPVSSDWSATDPAGTARGVAGKVRDERRGAINRAAEKVRARGDEPAKASSTQFQTKAERYARDTASASERASTRGSVAKAAEASGHVQKRDETLAGRAEMREAVEKLRQRYPGKKASDFVKIAKDWDASFRADSVGTREQMLEAYAKVSPENFRDYQAPPEETGVRGAVRRAQRDHDDLSDLAQFEKEFGHKLPGVLSELVKHDAAMVSDPAGTSARLAAAAGAPVTERQAQAFEQKQHQERARAQDSANVSRALDLIVQHNVLEGFGDDATLNAVADILESKSFKRTGDRLADLKAAHAQVMSNRTKSVANDRASKSISGGPSTPRGGQPDAPSVRGSIDRARGRAG